MQKTLSQHIIEARRRFPRGLEQPEGSLRFGADALLLAAFAARHLPPEKSGPGKCGPDECGPGKCGPDECGADNRGPDNHPERLWAGAANPGPTLVAELGCGCGAALLGLAMLRPHICGLGLERELPLVKAAKGNAARLGLSDQLRFLAFDLEDKKALATLRAPVRVSGLLPTADAPLPPDNGNKERQPYAVQLDMAQPAGNRLDAVLANPPYDRGGRPSPRHMRERALRTTPGADSHTSALDTFCRAAATLLRHQGRFFCIYDAQALPRLCVALNAVKLGVRRILPVQSHRDEPARRVLVEARKNAAHDTVLETPLILHDAPGSDESAINAPKTSAPGTKASEGNASETNAPCSTEPHNTALCDTEPCGSRSCAAEPHWSARALAFCPWLDGADASHTAAADVLRTADNAFTAP
ncbi:MAG: hypothetical protein RBR41_05430 [Desulfovibrio sp.]|uniref:hypothetical protein n=1 Tax=Desulfovibrio sp. TaxID=885 RepID=UPI002A370FFF|nr:hypothetical protein [Desulfovibrio sp.]MDY0259090.1 hypothetical protein [Desulfovibrio sp.]